MLEYYNDVSSNTSDEDDRSQSSCDSWGNVDNGPYSKSNKHYDKLDSSEIENFTTAISKLTFEKNELINCPCGNNMNEWRESNSLSVINKGNKYHCASKGQKLSGMMSHTKDVCINQKCPLRLAFYHLTFDL